MHEDELVATFLASREARALRAARVSVVAAGLTDSAGARSLDDVRAGALLVIELRGLDRSGTLQLVSRILGVQEGCADLAEFLHQHCSGNPRRVAEALQLALDRRLLTFDPDRGWSLPEPAALGALSRAVLEEAAAGPLAALGSAARRAATSGSGGASHRTAAVPSAANRAASASIWPSASAWIRAARSRVARPSVSALLPGGLTAPVSETCGSNSAGRRNRSPQWVNRSGWQRIVTGTSAGSWFSTATVRFRWPNPWLVT